MKNNNVAPSIHSYSVLLSTLGMAGQADRAVEVSGQVLDAHLHT
jgi:hypothetical protein